ncbi:hypothetical protein ACHAXS_013094 [Conticribra weissflogii]
MRLNSASFWLAATIGVPATFTDRSNLFSSSLFASAEEAQCPGGAKPDKEGQCLNPLVEPGVDDEEESSDDEEAAQRSTNPHAHKMEEGEEKPPTTCESYLKLTGFKDAVYETKSFYQEVAWSENVNKPDVCMSLDDILQICHSYRPHYHEPFVHFPAAYLKDFKRVVFVGGGDSMLLHESLKYPNVELVLGLELDQKVVRESLKHFHTQPHFEDPRVQWWFGDAAKSLALLPREWFGTFDLVMVDLSETAMSISVTDDLDIFGALALLMKPEGIFVKNELYYGQMSKLFDHSVFVYMVDYPILCDQDWAMGSNKIDFLHPKIDGGLVEANNVRTLEYDPLEDEDEHYKLIKDYSRNDARKQGKCAFYDAEMERAQKGDDEEKEHEKPTRSAGVMNVVEVDNVTNFSDLDSEFKHVLEAQGLRPLAPAVTHTLNEGEATSAIFIGMEEGYVDAHVYPSKNHIGLEIVLWSKIAKQDQVRTALLVAMGVEKGFSSYRVIHGGMLGAKNWKEDVDAIGPVKKNLRECDPVIKAAEPQIGQGPIPTETFNAAVSSALSLLPKKMDKVVAVVCGKQGKNSCKTLDVLREDVKVDSIVAIWVCTDDAQKDNNDSGDKVSNVYFCDKRELKRAAKVEEGFSAVVIDPEAPDSLVHAMEGEFCKKRDAGQHVLLRDQVSFMTSLSTDAENQFFNMCIRNIMKKMVRSTRIVIDETAEFGIIGTNNPGFVRRVVGVAESITKKTGIRTIIDKMKGGPVQQQKNYDPEHYPANAYDEKDALRQYTFQVPLASQSIYHLEVRNEDESKSLSAEVVKAAFDAVLEKSSRFENAKRVEFNDEIGDGTLNAAIRADAHVIATWDGTSRITLNILTFGEKYELVPPNDPVPDTVLVEHKSEVIDVFISMLPKSTSVGGREQMPRGSNRTVNFKKDINAVPGCTDHYDLCVDFAKDGDCDDDEEQPWMHKYCALSCGTCEKMQKMFE